MRRREFLSTTAAAVTSALLPPLNAQSTTRPNIIVILTDDQGFGDLGVNGATDAKTPNLDRLANEGIRFTDWHATSPVCSPSRASVLTGKYPQRAGIVQVLNSRPTFDVPGLKANETTIAKALKGAGYRTAAIGKWHVGSAPESRPMAQGFDEFFGFYSGWIDYYSHRYYTLSGNPGATGPVPQNIFHDFWRNNEPVHPEPEYQTELLAKEARAFIGRQPANQPFFIYLTFGAPHYPMMAPQKYVDRFPKTMDQDRRMHLAMMAAIDDAVGSITDELKRRGMDRDTVIFYQADNGATEERRADHEGRLYRGGSNGEFKAWKGSLWEGGHRVPAFIHWPAKLTPRVERSPGMGLDVMPTLLGMAGIPTPAGKDGANLSVTLLGARAWPERILYWEYDNQQAVRKGDWKLVLRPRPSLAFPNTDDTWLSNLKDDPGEKRNWFDDKPEIVKELKQLLAEWRW